MQRRTKRSARLLLHHTPGHLPTLTNVTTGRIDAPAPERALAGNLGAGWLGA
jgi:hypothetical protein